MGNSGVYPGQLPVGYGNNNERLRVGPEELDWNDYKIGMAFKSPCLAYSSHVLLSH
jgi:hypothetical protein